MKEEKIRMSIRLASGIREKLSKEKFLTGKSETAIIEEALSNYFTKEHDEELAELFLKKFDDKYKNLFTRLRLALGSTDKNVQTLLNVKNSELFVRKEDPENFLSIHEMKHGMIEKSEEAVKEQIALYKQKKDNAPVKEKKKQLIYEEE